MLSMATYLAAELFMLLLPSADVGQHPSMNEEPDPKPASFCFAENLITANMNRILLEVHDDHDRVDLETHSRCF